MTVDVADRCIAIAAKEGSSMAALTYTTPEMTVTTLEEIDVLTASGDVYEGDGEYSSYESRDAGEFDDFEIDWG